MGFDADLFRQIILVLVSVAGTLGIGAGARRILSKDARDRAKNGAEEDYFASALKAITEDRALWRKSAEEAWAKVREMEVECAICKLELRQARSQLKLQNRLTRRYPDLDLDFRQSDSAPFGDRQQEDREEG